MAKESIWLYSANTPLAIVTATIYLVPTLILAYQTAFKYRSRFFLCVLVGSSIEVGGYIARAVSSRRVTEIVRHQNHSLSSSNGYPSQSSILPCTNAPPVATLRHLLHAHHHRTRFRCRRQLPSDRTPHPNCPAPLSPPHIWHPRTARCPSLRRLRRPVVPHPGFRHLDRRCRRLEGKRSQDRNKRLDCRTGHPGGYLCVVCCHCSEVLATDCTTGECEEEGTRWVEKSAAGDFGFIGSDSGLCL